MGMNLWAICGMAMAAVATFALGLWGSHSARTTSDFLAARRVVPEQRNAAAISGEYLSAASFLGIAGLVLKDGADALWYPIGFASGYLGLMLFVAAPLRRSGAYTLPDFVDARLSSARLRWLATLLVVVIGWLYLVPQLQAAGLTLCTLTRLPCWVGLVGAAVIVFLGVLGGGMRAVTLVQAFQYWLKLFAITLPAFALFVVFLAGDPKTGRPLSAPAPPVFEHDTTVHIDVDVRLRITEPVWLTVSGSADQGTFGNGVVYARPDVYPVLAGTNLTFPRGSAVPAAMDAETHNASWLSPHDGGTLGLVETYSLLIATFLGTMGLPHVFVRFYTNPSGHGARRTTLFVLVMLGAFYLFPTIFGLLSRTYVPRLLVTGKTDAAVLLLPGAMLENWIGGILSAITAAGAFAAFLSTSSGLLMSVVGVLSTNVLRGRAADFRLIAFVATAVPLVLALGARHQDISQSVSVVFAMAASTFCPMLVLGIWWRGLTAIGAASGAIVGGISVLSAAIAGMVAGPSSAWWSSYLQQPALVTVPAAFLTAYVVSRMTQSRIPSHVSRVMLRMHAPDRLGFVEDRTAQRVGPSGADAPANSSEGRHHR